MISLLVGLILAQSTPQTGFAWTSERTYRFINEAEGIDYTNVERTDYVVEAVEAKGYTIGQSRRLTATRFGADTVPSEAPPKVSKLKFGPGGVPAYEEDTDDLVRARIDRMQWAVAEERKGVSWTRRFPAVGTLPAAKLTMRPSGANGDSRTIAIGYVEEGGEARGEGTAVVVGPQRIVSSLKATFTEIYPPKGDKSVKLVVNQAIVKK